MGARGTWEWRRFFAFAAGLTLLSAALPSDLAGLVGLVVGVAGVVALVGGARRHQVPHLAPFGFLAAGGSSFLVGNVVRAVQGGVTGVDNPFPSLGDPFFYLGYVLCLVGIFSLVRLRSADVEGDNLLDAVMVALCIGALAAAVVVLPYAAKDGVSALERSITIGYNVGDVLIVAGMVRLAVGSARKSTAYYLLTGALCCTIATDAVLTWQGAGGSVDHLLAVTSPMTYVFLGAVGLHPMVASLTDRPALRDIQLTGGRLAVLFAAVSAMAVQLLVALFSGDRDHVLLATVCAILVALLALARLTLLVQANERKARRASLLREAAGELAAATNLADMHRIAARVAASLLPDGAGWCVTGDGDGAITSAGHLRDLEPVLERAAALHAGSQACSVDVGSGTPRVVVAVSVVLRGKPAGGLLAATDGHVGQAVIDALESFALQYGNALDARMLAEELARRANERWFRALIEHSSDLVTLLDVEGRVVFASPASRNLLGIHEEDLLGEHPLEHIHPEDRPFAAGLLDRAYALPGVVEPIEARFRHRDGEWRWFEVLAENLLDTPEINGVVVHARDVTDRRRAQEELATREARFRSLVQHAADLIAIVDGELRFTYVSPAARTMLGIDPASLVGRPIADVVRVDELFDGPRLRRVVPEASIRDAGGRWRTAEVTLTDLRRDPAVGGIVLNARDVSERKMLESKLRHLALHDPLTGLANRNLFNQRLAAALASGGEPVGVLYIDVDDFKALNDGLGHTQGDDALCQLAERVVACTRNGDLAARLGGDEFAVIVRGDTSVAMDVGARILAAAREPMVVQGREVNLPVSVGAAVGDADATAESLMRDADIAMYAAKSDGKDRARLFEPEMLTTFSERRELRRDLHHAVERGELRLLYQPVYEIATGRMTSVEALVRWEHPTRGTVSPVQFIPLAEETGDILEIGAWVLEEACAQMAAWRRAGADHPHAVSVNVSVAQLGQDGLIERVADTLTRHGLDAGALVLEVTESVLAADLDLVQIQLSALTALGVRLALDDFGTGYSSLGYLQHFHLDTLKIDRTFLSTTSDPEQQEAILRAIVGLAHSRLMTTVAEGVETTEQLEMLRRLGCTAVQGFLFARPLPAGEVLGAADRAAAVPASASASV
jgi:diguanylate cyclase (GGDEF)-like protein/PAS domain S-box-containing protein